MVLAVVLLVVPVYVVGLVSFGASPKTTDVGYAPAQPVPYSHALHAGELGMDCRYCHWTVTESAYAAIPPTEVCMNCHTNIYNASAKLAPVIESHKTGKPIEWIRVHDLPDFAYFNHSAHVERGVSCISCHGDVRTMEVVRQVEPLSMGWCLECHRNPEPHLRDPDQVFDMDWSPPEGQTAEAYGARIRDQLNINPSTDCSTCHR
jgi:hypothetical protein